MKSSRGKTIAIVAALLTLVGLLVAMNRMNDDAMKGVNKYLGEKGRLEIHIPTTMADTVRGAPITVAAQAPPVRDRSPRQKHRHLLRRAPRRAMR